VLAAQVKVVSHMRAGARWPDLHELAEATLLEGLQRAGLVDAEASPAELVSAGIGAVFMPHGLGHLIGIDTHDVGGYLSAHPPRAARAGICRLRTARVLEAGMVITVEPGCYFIDALLDAALADPARARYLRAGALAAYRGFGGVRIEDGVLVTHDGAQSLAACPRTVAEIEDVMAGGTWPPARDRLPELRRAWARLSSDGASMERFEVPAAD
jgi:Xaa-Pro dipeptidase